MVTGSYDFVSVQLESIRFEVYSPTAEKQDSAIPCYGVGS